MMGFGWSSLGLLGMVGMVLFWMVVIAAGIWLLARLFPQTATHLPAPPAGPGSDTSPSAIEILKERYARGEITYAQYQEMRQNLEQ